MRAFRVRLPEADEDDAVTALWEAGTAGIEVARSAAGTLELLAYFPDSMAEPPCGLPPAAEVAAVPVPDVDWVARFRDGFRALRSGRFLIAPAWAVPEPSPDVLLVDPGRAFGTGTHETTRLCLAALEELARLGPLGRTLDLGSGTALLAVAAARLGARPVAASDVDPEAVAASANHARLNGVRLWVVQADGATAFRAGSFDLVLANLTAPLLVARAAEIQRLLRPRAALVLSGLLVEDVPAVRSAYSGLDLPRERRDGEWAALVYGEAP
ncbi:MAG: 50S ribosomal protein L11 methyltransferase [Betaproteobacteria bacterium]